MDAYHHIKDGTPYPALLILTADNDARVSPCQSAKTTARLQAASTSGKPVLLRAESGAGHGFSTQDQRVEELADSWTFLFGQLGAGTPRRR